MNVEKDATSFELGDSTFLSKLKALCLILFSTLTRGEKMLLRSFSCNRNEGDNVLEGGFASGFSS